MPGTHVSGRKLDDELSGRALDLYVDAFDPLKLYFLQSDIDQFRQYRVSLDDNVRAGDLRIAYFIYRRFVRRVDERVAEAMALLDSDLDFTADEQIVIDGDAATYALNADQARDRWRRQIKYALLDLKDDGTDGVEARDQLRRRYSRYARRWKETSSDDILETFLTAVTTGYDPHSTYMSPQTLEDFKISMGLNLDGIGAALREKDGATVVSEVIPGGAADLHGKLQPDDVIISVGQGDESEITDIVEMPLKDVVKLIRGKAGTKVRLGVRPGGAGNVETYEIIRARVELESSAARGVAVEHMLPGTNDKTKIGYITLPSFYMDMDRRQKEQRGRLSVQHPRRRTSPRRTQSRRRLGHRAGPLAKRRWVADRSHLADRFVHRLRPRGPSQKRRRHGSKVRRRRTRHRVGWALGGRLQPIQCLGQRDLCRRDQGLPPRDRHRRPQRRTAKARCKP